MDITKLMSTQIVSNVQLAVIVHQQLKQSHVQLDIIKIDLARQHVLYVQLEQVVMVRQPAPVRSQNILSLEWPTVSAVRLVIFVLMLKAMVWLPVNLEHMSTTITVNNVRLVQSARHQFRAQLLALAQLIFVLMQAAKEILFVQFVPQDLHALPQVHPIVTPVNIHWKVNAIATTVPMVISVLQLT